LRIHAFVQLLQRAVGGCDVPVPVEREGGEGLLRIHHVDGPAGIGQGAAGFHERQVARRDVGFQREVELGKAATLAPGAQQGTNGLRVGARGQNSLGGLHAPDLSTAVGGSHYLPGNRPAMGGASPWPPSTPGEPP